MKIATFNVNSIRRRLPVVTGWLTEHKPDVFCLQETKVQDHDFPTEAFREIGYHATFRGMKGYNGVATLTLVPPERVFHGFHEGPENEDFRLLLTRVRGVDIINSYVPQGYAIDSEKYVYKLGWLRRIRRYFDEQLNLEQQAIWLGDLNIAPQSIDVYHPEKRTNDPDFHIDAREAFQLAMAWGWVDVFRQLHPDKVQYTYWDYFRGSFSRNYGWRIDHILATPSLAARCKAVEVDMNPRREEGASDHTILWAEFD